MTKFYTSPAWSSGMVAVSNGKAFFVNHHGAIRQLHGIPANCEPVTFRDFGRLSARIDELAA